MGGRGEGGRRRKRDMVKAPLKGVMQSTGKEKERKSKKDTFLSTIRIIVGRKKLGVTINRNTAGRRFSNEFYDITIYSRMSCSSFSFFGDKLQYSTSTCTTLCSFLKVSDKIIKYSLRINNNKLKILVTEKLAAILGPINEASSSFRLTR